MSRWTSPRSKACWSPAAACRTDSQASATRKAPEVLHQLAEGRAFDVLHRIEVNAIHRVGVVGQDNVGMRQRGGGQDFAVEARNGRWVVQTFLADELERDDSSQLAVAGFEDQAHAAFAQPFQQYVRAQDQVAAPSLENLVDLIGTEPAALQQLFGQGMRFLEAPLEIAGQLVPLRRIEQATLAKQLNEGSDRVPHSGSS